MAQVRQRLIRQEQDLIEKERKLNVLKIQNEIKSLEITNEEEKSKKVREKKFIGPSNGAPLKGPL